MNHKTSDSIPISPNSIDVLNNIRARVQKEGFKSDNEINQIIKEIRSSAHSITKGGVASDQ